MKHELQDPSELLLDGYAVLGCTVLFGYLLSLLIF
jgi:hypothetical protein